MKLLTLIVKPSKTESVKEALDASGIGGATILEASGYGSQRGQSETYRGTEYRIDTNPKVMFQVACDDDDTSSIIEAVKNAAGTGKIGDGKIFITELTDVVRIRTGDTGSKAI